jgi:Ricin-type beta-trefoil lectin domain-like/Ricin-type beta-trefoil lectin domain/Glycosyl hydrolases family 39
MKTRRKRLAVAAAVVLAVTVPLLRTAPASASESLTVNLASVTGTANAVGEGFLYGMSQDGTEPADQFIEPLGLTAFRGGGHASGGGWIGDDYTYGTSTQADVAEVIATAKRLSTSPYHAQYQVILSDLYGADGSQPSDTSYPCADDNCANWVTFLDDVVGAIKDSGLTNVAFDIWNEPDESEFWSGGADTTQYFDMWDTAVQTIKSLDSSAVTVGPSLAADPAQNSTEWTTWLAHVKSAGTEPTEISDHLEGDGDDPVSVASSIESDESAAGISDLPLTANEFLPDGEQTAGQSAWYLARFAQSAYTSAMRGNWDCCLTPDLGGVIVSNSSGGYSYTGQWWTFRTYADLTGSLVSTSGEVGTTAISASEDSAKRRVVAVLGDEDGYTGSVSVTFSGVSSVSSWLANGGNVDVTVYRIPDSSPLNSPSVVYSKLVSDSSGSITVPVTFEASHDAFAIYLTPGFAAGFSSTMVDEGSGLCADEYDWTTEAAAQFDQWTCNGGTNQQFTFTPTSSGSDTYFIHPMTPDYCLDVSGASTASGAAIDQWPCNYDSNEEFTLDSVGTNEYEVVAVNSGLCAEPSGASTASDASLVQVSCSSATADTWLIQPGQFPGGYHQLVIGSDSQCLDVYGASTTAGAEIDQWTCNGGTNQQFQFVAVSGGYGELRAENSGDDVAVSGSSTASGALIVQQAVTGASSSLWLPVEQSDGTYEFKNENSGLCLDVTGASTTAGQQLDQYACKNETGTNQDFAPQ